jgi:Lhr-like helicase
MTSAGQTQADIAVLKLEVDHIKELVERNHREGIEGRDEIKKTLKELRDTITTNNTTLVADLNERKGAEKLASTLRVLFASTISVGIYKALAWLGSVPRP